MIYEPTRNTHDVPGYRVELTLDEQMWLDRAQLAAERRLARERRREAAHLANIA